jgi:hypothetical protein
VRLAQWQDEVQEHLKMIRSGADICLRHVESLPIRPGFVTFAEDDLARVEKTMLEALNTIRLARALFANKAPDEE